jgi:hypothetical protein
LDTKECGGLVESLEQVFRLSGEAGEDVVGRAQTGPVDEALFVGDPLPACGQHGVCALAGGDSDRPCRIGQVTLGGMGGAGVPPHARRG